MKKTIMMLLSVILFGTTITSIGYIDLQAASCSTTAECNEQLEQHKKDREAKQSTIDDIEAQAASTEDQLKVAKEDKRVVEEEIDIALQTIETLKKDIKKNEEEIEAKEVDILENLSYQQKQHNSNMPLQLLASSKSLTDLTRRWKVLETVNQHDKQIVDDFKVLKETNTALKVEQEEKHELAEEKKADLEVLEEELDTVRKKLHQEAADKYAEMDALESSQADIQKQLDLLNNPSNPVAPTPGNSDWSYPTNGGVITTQYMSPTYAIDFGRTHPAVDIAPGAGTPVYAIAAGTVIVSEWHAGYGYRVAIKHGDYISFYAHLQYLNVSFGEYIGKGTVIGAVGNTGYWSEGAHLHLEVYYGLSTFTDSKWVRENASVDPVKLFGDGIYTYGWDSW